MKFKKILVSSLVGFLVLLLATGYVSNTVAQSLDRSDSPEGFENNDLMPGLDIYINESSGPMQSLALNELGVNEQAGWKIQRYLLLPASANLDDWTIFDHDAIIVVGGFGGMAGPALDEDRSFDIFGYRLPNWMTVVTAQEVVTETGLTAFTGRSVDGVTNVDANDVVGQTDAVITDTDFESFNATTSVAAVTNNYTVPDNQIDSGVVYTAGDSKSITDYAKEVVLANGKTYYDTQNGSIVAFSYDDFDNLQNVVMTMDEETSSAPGQEGFSLRRSRVWMKASKTTSSWGSSAKRTVDKNVFQPIKNVPKTLTGIPNKAKHFFTKTLNPGHYLASKIGIGGTVGTWVKRIGAAIAIIAFILLIVGIIFLVRNKGKLMK